MEGIEVLFWGLSVLFCLVMVFAILVWCRGWRRQEREETERQIQAFASEVARLTSAIEALDHTAASLQTADEQLAGGINELRTTVSRVRTLASASASSEAGPAVAKRPPPPAPSDEAARTVRDEPMKDGDDPVEGGPRFEEARALLLSGQSPLEVAKALDIGAAEVRMMARMIEAEKRQE